MAHEDKRRLAALSRGTRRGHKRVVRAVGGARWTVLKKWLEPKWTLALLASLASMRMGCSARQDTQQVAHSMGVMVQDSNREALQLDSLRSEVSWLRSEVGRLEALGLGGAPRRPAQGERAAPSPRPLEYLAAPARAAWAGVRWLFTGGI